MKKLVYLIIGLFIGAILTYYFCPREPLCKMPIKENIVVKPPKDTISIAEATTFSKNWEKYNPKEIDSSLEFEGSKKQTRSVWWSKSDIEEYLAYSKYGADSLHYNFTGLRVYFANYGTDKGKPTKRYRNTLFIVPTGNKKQAKASSLNINLPPDDGDIPLPPLNNGGGGTTGYP
ncbi:hypothetical protein [Neotamlana sedimentorum]|uniref:hypothetical protein n=1 Tax=Neotamlana sedimentorum TaxID=1435349 RepID=UPI00069ACA65|nr:hypothetical protein [Tamlana sedimentorum]